MLSDVNVGQKKKQKTKNKIYMVMIKSNWYDQLLWQILLRYTYQS